MKNKAYNSDSLLVSIWGELVNAGLNFRVTKTDLAVAIVLEEQTLAGRTGSLAKKSERT